MKGTNCQVVTGLLERKRSTTGSCPLCIFCGNLGSRHPCSRVCSSPPSPYYLCTPLSLGPQESEGNPVKGTLPSSGHLQRYGLKTGCVSLDCDSKYHHTPLTPSCWEGDRRALQIRNGNKGGCPEQPSNPLMELCLRDLTPRPTCGCSSSLAYNREDGLTES